MSFFIYNIICITKIIRLYIYKVEKIVFNQPHTLQVHISAVQSLILFLKRDNVGLCLILSSRVLNYLEKAVHRVQSQIS